MTGICRHGISLSNRCDSCRDESGSRKDRLRDRRDPVQAFQCRQCDYVTKYRDTLIRHVREEHTPTNEAVHDPEAGLAVANELDATIRKEITARLDTKRREASRARRARIKTVVSLFLVLSVIAGISAFLLFWFPSLPPIHSPETNSPSSGPPPVVAVPTPTPTHTPNPTSTARPTYTPAPTPTPHPTVTVSPPTHVLVLQEIARNWTPVPAPTTRPTRAVSPSATLIPPPAVSPTTEPSPAVINQAHSATTDIISHINPSTCVAACPSA